MHWKIRLQRAVYFAILFTHRILDLGSSIGGGVNTLFWKIAPPLKKTARTWEKFALWRLRLHVALGYLESPSRTFFCVLPWVTVNLLSELFLCVALGYRGSHFESTCGFVFFTDWNLSYLITVLLTYTYNIHTFTQREKTIRAMLVYTAGEHEFLNLSNRSLHPFEVKLCFV